MAKPLRAQLNQVRAWVRQGRTDAWIAHQLEVSTSELREFRRRHKLTANGEDADEEDLRDEIEAEIAAAVADEEEEAEEEADEEAGAEAEVEPESEGAEEPGRGGRAGPAGREEQRPSGAKDGERPRRRRRRRRGGRKRAGANLQASFDHGEADGYGLWLDPAIADDPIYTEHWAGHRKIEVTVEPDQIVIRRSED